ncbi:9824_t:CDS:2, partial [Gigaspora margarita]
LRTWNKIPLFVVDSSLYAFLFPYANIFLGIWEVMLTSWNELGRVLSAYILWEI